MLESLDGNLLFLSRHVQTFNYHIILLNILNCIYRHRRYQNHITIINIYI